MRRDPTDGIPAWFKAMWLFCAALGLVVIGVAIWAVVRIVIHFT